MHWVFALILAAIVVWGLSRLDKQMATRLDPGARAQANPRAADPPAPPTLVQPPDPTPAPPKAAEEKPDRDIEDDLPTILADGGHDLGRVFEAEASAPDPISEPEAAPTPAPASPPPQPAMERLSAALQAGEKPDSALVAALAENPLTRREAYLRLKTAKKASAMPAKLRGRPALAEGDLAVWLAGSDFGAPTEIEQTDLFTIDTASEGKFDWYLFKFRSADSAWMAGVSGAWRRSDGPSGVPSGDTGGYLGPWDAGDDAHASGVRVLMEAWEKSRKSGA